MKVVAYCRVSRDDSGQDPKRQLDVLQKWANANDHEIVGHVLDEGTSGALAPMERIKVHEAIKIAKANGAEAIATECVDRWTRGGISDYARSTASLEFRHKLKIVHADVPAGLEGAWYELYISIMATVARAWRENLQSQIKSGLERAKREGWKKGKPGRRLKANLEPHEIAYVREQKALGRRGAGWGRMALELTRNRGALEVVDRKARDKRTVSPSWLRTEWSRIQRGSIVRSWKTESESKGDNCSPLGGKNMESNIEIAESITINNQEAI